MSFKFKFKKIFSEENKKNWRKTKHFLNTIEHGGLEFVHVQKYESFNNRFHLHSFYEPAEFVYSFKSKILTERYYLIDKEFYDFEWKNARKLIKGYSAAKDRKIKKKSR